MMQVHRGRHFSRQKIGEDLLSAALKEPSCWGLGSRVLRVVGSFLSPLALVGQVFSIQNLLCTHPEKMPSYYTKPLVDLWSEVHTQI
ncbi:hypothetical protein Mp_2g12790 [Marchantia polymorpha subsp. ruderalis]|nr:hypothetical protein Mp_2g12790 [Marchantia polymorpha subsp. ruderalis]